MPAKYTHDYEAFGAHVLMSDWMVDEMRRRANNVADRALQIAPYDPADTDGDHYIDHFRVEAHVDNERRRAVARVINDHEAAVSIEYGSGPNRPQGGSSPRHRVLGRALDAARD